MKIFSDTTARRAFALTFGLATASVPAWAATPAPAPLPTAKTMVPHPPVPTTALHTEFVVEVNAKGQVVRVKSAKGCKDLTYNAQTYGNVLQMWIRHPDGSAEVGLYRVTYDFNPQTKTVRRGISLVRAGGTWGNEEGAATQMIETAEREARAGQKVRSQGLPPLNAIVGKPSPSAHP
jgi:hypothetical protein